MAGDPGPAQATPRLEATGTVHALARLEPEGGLIVVGAHPGARLEAIAVKEGDRVEKGAVLAVIEGQEAARASSTWPGRSERRRASRRSAA